MGIIRDLFGGGPVAALAPPERGGGHYLGGGSFAPLDATGRAPRAAEGPSIPAAYAAGGLIAQTVAGLPRHIVRRGDRKRTEVRTEEFRHVWGKPARNGPLRIVHSEAVMASIVFHGNAFEWLGRQGPYDAAAPWRNVVRRQFLHPSRVRVFAEPDGSRTFMLDGDRALRFTERDVLHVPGLGTDGVRGLSPIELHAVSLGVFRAIEQYGGDFFARDATPGGILKTEQIIDADQAEEAKARWQAQQRSQEIAVLGAGMTFQHITIPPEQAQWLESLRYRREDVFMLYRVMPHLVGLSEKPSAWGTGLETLSNAFVKYTLLPYLIRVEQAESDALLPPDLELKLNVSALLRGDTKARAEYYAKGRQYGWISAEDIRELEDMPPRDVPDDFLSPLNFDRQTPGGGTVTPVRRQSGPPPQRPGAFDLGLRADLEAALAGVDLLSSPDPAETPYADAEPPAGDEGEVDTVTADMAARWLAGRSYGQIAIATGHTPSAVRARLRRAFGDRSPTEVRAEQ